MRLLEKQLSEKSAEARLTGAVDSGCGALRDLRRGVANDAERSRVAFRQPPLTNHRQSNEKRANMHSQLVQRECSREFFLLTSGLPRNRMSEAQEKKLFARPIPTILSCQ